MKNKNLINYTLLCLAMIFFFCMSSCSSIKNVKYFADVPDSGKTIKLNKLNFIDPTIQHDDILSYSIQSIESSVTQALNLGNMQSAAVGNTSAGATGSQTISGVLVDRNGDIELAVLGKLHVGGLTIEQAREVVRKRASVDYNNVTVNLRFANFRVTIMGEVNRPGTFIAANEKVSIIDALGLAGDLTIYGKRENILLIRHYEDGSQEPVRLDLTKSSILNSPFYYLRQNDYIYVEPIKTKVVASDAIQNRNISILTAVTASLISLIAIVISTRR